jgi:hypothetical protein
MSAHRLIRYPFCGTSIVPFDAYGRSLLRHRRHFLRGFSTRFHLFFRPSGDVPRADICAATSHVRFAPNSNIDCVFHNVCFGPKADSCSAAKGLLFDHLVGGGRPNF